MAWTTPRTNWTPNDYMTLEDWARIQANTEYLYTALGCEFELENSDLLTADDIPYGITLTALARNVYRMYWNRVYSRVGELLTTPLPIGTFEAKEWLVGSPNPDYADINEIEALTIALKDWLDLVTGQGNELVSGTLKAGDTRVLQMFSRGR